MLSPGFLVALALLLTNDHLLKGIWPGWFTGKLSDFAGLFCFPIFFVALLPRQRFPIYLITAVGFLYWKLPLSNQFIGFIATHLHFEIVRALDYTDLIALSILPFSYQYSLEKRSRFGHGKRVFYWATGTVAIVAFLATSPVKTPMVSHQYPTIMAPGFQHCEASDSAVFFCSKNTSVRLEVSTASGQQIAADTAIHFSLIDSTGALVSDLRPNYLRDFHPFGLIYSTNYVSGADQRQLGFLDSSGKKVFNERFSRIESLQEHGDLEIFRKFKKELDSLDILPYPEEVLLFECRTSDSVYVMDRDLLNVAQLTEKSIQVLSGSVFLVPRKGTRPFRNKPIGTQKYRPVTRNRLDFPGTRYAIIGLDGEYLLTPFIEAAMYSGGDLWTLVCGTELLLFDVKKKQVVRRVTRSFANVVLMSHREIPSRATLYKNEWSLTDRRTTRTFTFPATDSLDNDLVAFQFLRKLWNADEQRNSYAWVCFGFDGMPIGVRQQYVPLDL